jgi:hypothetical protein
VESADAADRQAECAEYVLRDVAGGLEDYYLGLGEAPGVWFGGLARELRAEGVVEAEWLRA